MQFIFLFVQTWGVSCFLLQACNQLNAIRFASGHYIQVRWVFLDKKPEDSS